MASAPRGWALAPWGGPRSVPARKIYVLLAGACLATLLVAIWNEGALQHHRHRREGREVASLDRLDGLPPRPPADPAYCEEHFGLPWLERWNASARGVCRAPAGADTAKDSLPPAWVRCRTLHSDPHLPHASAPYVMCDGANVLLDPGKLDLARCLKHRPGYMCQHRSYLSHSLGSWRANCAWPGFELEAFSRDHQRDLFEALYLGSLGSSLDLGAPPERVLERQFTLFVAREVSEHANLFHATTDLLNAFLTLRTLGWLDRPHRVLLLDAHPAASMDAFWASVASSPSLPEPARALELEGPTLFERVAWSPPGYASLLFSDLGADAACAGRTSLFDAFRDWVLGRLLSDREAAFQGLGAAGTGDEVVQELQGLVQWRRWSEGRGGMEDCRLQEGEGEFLPSSRPLLLTFVSRRPTPTRPRLPRIVGNEEELVEALARLRPRQRPVCVAAVDFAALQLRQQALLVRASDLLVGMHGAALSWGLFMRPEAGLFELWPKSKGVWRCMEHMAHWAGARYARWAADGRHERQVTVVDAEAAAQVGLRLLEDVAA